MMWQQDLQLKATSAGGFPGNLQSILRPLATQSILKVCLCRESGTTEN